MVIVPGWMLADGQYAGLRSTDRVRTGLALEAASVVRRAGVPGVVQTGERTVLTTIAGRLVRADQTETVAPPPVLRSAGLSVLLPTAPCPPADSDVVATGFLTAEPYRWRPGSPATRVAPEGVAVWSVLRARARLGELSHVLERLPAEHEVEEDGVYLLDLAHDV